MADALGFRARASQGANHSMSLFFFEHLFEPYIITADQSVTGILCC